MATDPLGLIGSSGIGPQGPNGIGAGKNLPGGGQPVDPNAPSFKDVLMENLSEVNKLQQDANTAIEDLHAGRRDDVEAVLMATQKADTAFRMLQSVRNKLMGAYDEIKQIRV